MSCQQASRVQEDPYAFTEPAPLQANTSLYKHPHSNSATSSTTSPVIQAGTSLLTSNNGGANYVMQQQRTPATLPKVSPIKVTLVQSSSAAMAKSRMNGTTITTSPSGTVFRTVSVPQATTIVQRPIPSASAFQPSSTVPATTTTTTTSATVFTKPLQVQISPQQAGKFSRRVLASKSPNVSPAAIQTLRIVKSASPQQPVGVRPSIVSEGARRYLNHSSNSLLGPPPATTTVAPMAPLQSLSPTKIRLIQPQPQGKIFLHTPNSSNSLAAATHISNPASIAALRNSLARQNPSMLNKIPQHTAPATPLQQTLPPQIGNISTVLPTVKTTPTPIAINIRRTSPPTSQTSLETATTTVTLPSAPVSVAIPVPTPSPATLTTPPKQVSQSSQIITMRSKTPTITTTSSILKSQPIVQDDVGFTIPSFIISKQDPKADNVPSTVPMPSPPESKPAPMLTSTPTSSAPPPVMTATVNSSAATPSTPKSQGKVRLSAADRASIKSTQGTKRTKRSYSRSSHHETLERISTSSSTSQGTQVKEEEDSCDSKPPTIDSKPAPTIRFPKWKPPGAVAVPLNREWHAPDSYVFDICAPGAVSIDSLEFAPCTQDFWFEELYAGTELDATDAVLGIGRPRKGRKASSEEQSKLLLLNLDNDGELKKLSRDERLELKRAYLRRKAVQYWNGQKLRDSMPARKRLKTVEKIMGKLDQKRETMLQKNGGVEQPKCQRPGCHQVALLATSHCYQHITDNNDQRLFQQCTAKFSDNSQCRVPVFDISHELILCREHAWKHDNHDKMTAEVKLLKKPAAGVAAKKKAPKPAPIVTVRASTVTTAGSAIKKKNKKKKLTPFQQQMVLHQQQYKQQYSSINHTKPTLPPPPYGAPTVPAAQKSLQQPSPYRQTSSLLQQPQQQAPIRYQQNMLAPGAGGGSGGVVQIVPPQSTVTRNVHIPLNPQRQIQQPQPTLPLAASYQQPPLITQTHHQLQQQHMIGRNEDLMLNYSAQQQQFSQQHVQQILGGATTQDLLNICENSSAYASSEDTGVGGLSESELMVAQDVIEEIPFEIGNLNNVLSQLPPDAFNELLFSEQEQNGPSFESTQEEEEDLERALEVVGVKSLEDMTVESANFLGDFLDNVDDEMLDGSDICSDQMLQSPSTNDIRGLVHT